MVEMRWATTSVEVASEARRSARIGRFDHRVDRAGGVVEHQDPRPPQQRPGEGEPLALAAGEGDPTLPDDGVPALGQSFDEVLGVGDRGRRPQCLVVDGLAEGDVLADAVGEEERLLEHERHRGPHVVGVQVAQVDAAQVAPTRNPGRPGGAAARTARTCPLRWPRRGRPPPRRARRGRGGRAPEGRRRGGSSRHGAPPTAAPRSAPERRPVSPWPPARSPPPRTGSPTRPPLGGAPGGRSRTPASGRRGG